MVGAAVSAASTIRASQKEMPRLRLREMAARIMATFTCTSGSLEKSFTLASATSEGSGEASFRVTFT